MDQPTPEMAHAFKEVLNIENRTPNPEHLKRIPNIPEMHADYDSAIHESTRILQNETESESGQTTTENITNLENNISNSTPDRENTNTETAEVVINLKKDNAVSAPNSENTNTDQVVVDRPSKPDKNQPNSDDFVLQTLSNEDLILKLQEINPTDQPLFRNTLEEAKFRAINNTLVAAAVRRLERSIKRQQEAERAAQAAQYNDAVNQEVERRLAIRLEEIQNQAQIPRGSQQDVDIMTEKSYSTVSRRNSPRRRSRSPRRRSRSPRRRSRSPRRHSPKRLQSRYRRHGPQNNNPNDGHRRFRGSRKRQNENLAFKNERLREERRRRIQAEKDVEVLEHMNSAFFHMSNAIGASRSNTLFNRNRYERLSKNVQNAKSRKFKK